jgi:hypothetical protein
MINMREEKGTEEFNSRRIPKIRKIGAVVAAVVAKHRSSLATVLLPLRSDGRQSFPAVEGITGGTLLPFVYEDQGLSGR